MNIIEPNPGTWGRVYTPQLVGEAWKQKMRIT